MTDVFEIAEVEGLGELERTLGKISRDAPKDLRKELFQAGLPIARVAQDKARSEISGMARRKTVDWSQMRVGYARGGGGFVYVAPKQRGRKARGRMRRPNLVAVMRKKALEPAVHEGHRVVLAAAERAISKTLRRAGV